MAGIEVNRIPGSISRRRFGRLLAGATGSVCLLGAGLQEASAGLKRALGNAVGLAGRYRWTSAAPQTARLRAASPYDRITIHHDGGTVNRHRTAAEVAAALRRIRAGHSRLGYGDIGYHFLIDYAGRLWEGRPLEYEGAHVAGHNPGNLGIALLGNYEQQRPRPAQLATLSGVVTLLVQRLQLSPGRIYGHRDLSQTLCPGRYLYPGVRDLQAGAQRVARAAGPSGKFPGMP